jgi:hypothetical protein
LLGDLLFQRRDPLLHVFRRLIVLLFELLNLLLHIIVLLGDGAAERQKSCGGDLHKSFRLGSTMHGLITSEYPQRTILRALLTLAMQSVCRSDDGLSLPILRGWTVQRRLRHADSGQALFGLCQLLVAATEVTVSCRRN